MKKDECVEIIRHIVALGIENIENYDEILKILTETLKIDFDKEESRTINFAKGEIHNCVSLLRKLKFIRLGLAKL